MAYRTIHLLYLHVLGSLGHGQAGGGTGQQVQGGATQEGGALAVPQAVPDQGGGTEEGDDLEGGAQAQHDPPVLGTVVILGKHGGQRILGNDLTAGHSEIMRQIKHVNSMHTLHMSLYNLQVLSYFQFTVICSGYSFSFITRSVVFVYINNLTDVLLENFTRWIHWSALESLFVGACSLHHYTAGRFSWLRSELVSWTGSLIW